MKKLLIPVILILFLFSCKKETFDSENVGNQNALVIYFGGTWCVPCGQYGKPTKEELHKKYGKQLSIISCQVNSTFYKDSMNTETSNKMSKAFNTSGVPTWFTGGVEAEFENKFGGNIQANTITTTIDEILNISPKAIVQADVFVKDKKIHIDSKTTFLEKSNIKDGEYFLAAYLTENNLYYIQANDGSTDRKNIHDHILKASFTTNIHGESFNKSDINKNEILNKSLSLDYLDSYLNKDFTIILVVWKKLSNGNFVASNTTSYSL